MSYENVKTCGNTINTQAEITKKAIVKECANNGYLISSSFSNNFISVNVMILQVMVFII